MQTDHDQESKNSAPSHPLTREELARVVNSAVFANAERLRAFLTYVVEESLSGRAHLIAGKTIAQDIYGRSPDDGSDSIVRVDAGRLRRKLNEYYADEGRADAIRIHIDSGGYAPRFETLDRPIPDQAAPDTRSTLAHTRRGDLPLIAGAAGLALALGVALSFWTTKDTPQDQTQDDAFAVQNALERAALAAKSTAALQAANLAEQASGLLFPIADLDHQRLATGMFQRAIQIDPSLADGYAGAAHSLATRAFLAQTPETRARLLAEATAYADKAIDLDPRSGWSHSAASWIAFASGQYDKAVELSQIAVSLNSVDSAILDFRGLILVLSGHFEQSATVTAPDRPRNSKGRHPANLNIHAVAQFHLGHPEAAIAAIDAARQSGGPVSELSLIFKAAAYQALNDTTTASALLQELQTNWPDFRPDIVLNRFYQHPEDAKDVLDMLRAAGWTSG